MGWREIVSSLLLCGGALCRPSLLGAARGFPFQQNIINQRHHGHASHLHHRQGHSLEVSPLDGLYGAPAELPSYGEEELPSYGQEELPAYTSAAASGSAPSPSVAAPMMMMDPSYYFEYKSADSERTEDADSTGSITGKYGYKTAGGNDILVQYSASPQTGFVIENMDELAAALERSAAEAALVKAKPYTGETVEVEYVGPKVDSVTNTQDSSYSYAYSGTDKAQQEVADAQGNVKGSYSFKTADGQDFEVKYTSGVGGFVVDNLEELLALSNPQSAEYAAVVAEHAAIAAAARKNSEDTNGPAAETYVHEDIDAEPYIHEEIEAESYVHQDIEAEPYIHEEIEAEPYIDEQVSYVHNEIAAEPYIHEEGSTDPTAAASGLYGAPSARSTGAQAVMDRSFMFTAVGDDHEFMESADAAGERTGSYSYVNPDGENILVKYSAGKEGFVILNPREVLPQAHVV